VDKIKGFSGFLSECKMVVSPQKRCGLSFSRIIDAACVNVAENGAAIGMWANRFKHKDY
jgi:hypothetical protein